MASYEIHKKKQAVTVDLEGVAGQTEQLIEALRECQGGNCSCPTDEYQKLESMDVEQHGDVIQLQLGAKPGSEFDTAEIAACLDHMTAKLSDSTD